MISERQEALIKDLDVGDILGDEYGHEYIIKGITNNREKVLLHYRRVSETDWAKCGKGWYTQSEIRACYLKEKAILEYDPKQQGDQEDDI